MGTNLGNCSLPGGAGNTCYVTLYHGRSQWCWYESCEVLFARLPHETTRLPDRASYHICLKPWHKMRNKTYGRNYSARLMEQHTMRARGNILMAIENLSGTCWAGRPTRGEEGSIPHFIKTLGGFFSAVSKPICLVYSRFVLYISRFVLYIISYDRFFFFFKEGTRVKELLKINYILPSNVFWSKFPQLSQKLLFS